MRVLDETVMWARANTQSRLGGPFAHNVDVRLELLIVYEGSGLKATHGHFGLCSVSCRYMQAAYTMAQSQLERATIKTNIHYNNIRL